jgi:hypothetical protein
MIIPQPSHLRRLRYVYERLTPPNGKPTFFTLVATQLVSALWHGLYPGAHARSRQRGRNTAARQAKGGRRS